MPERIRGQCFANMASRMIETDKTLVGRSLDMCSFAGSLGSDGLRGDMRNLLPPGNTKCSFRVLDTANEGIIVDLLPNGNRGTIE